MGYRGHCNSGNYQASCSLDHASPANALGIITKAVLKLYPNPKSKCVVWTSLESTEKAIELLSHLRAFLDNRLTAFELMSSATVSMIREQFPDSPNPISGIHSWYVLFQADGSESDSVLTELVEQCMSRALETELVTDVAFATSGAQANALWLMRENVADAQNRYRPHIKHDISLQVSSIPEFITRLNEIVAVEYPGASLIVFGHLGDGNLHVNLCQAVDKSDVDWQAFTPDVNRIVRARDC